MKDILDHIAKLKKQLTQLQPLSTDNQHRLDKKFRMEWNYNSNHIEGNTLTYGETELLLIFGETKGNHEFREYEEMKGHDVALKLIEDLAFDRDRNLSENFIREINKAILKEPFYKEAITPDGQPTRRLIKIGEYKSFPNSVRLQNGEMFNYASPSETGALMGDLVAWYLEASANDEKHPIEVAAELHYKFVCIHPFDDGNGRISRLLMNYHLIKNEYPPVIIKSADKKNYLFALHEADTGNIEAFKSYIAEQLIWSYEISIKAAKGESVEEFGDWEKKLDLVKKKYLKKKSEVFTSDEINSYIKTNIVSLITDIFDKWQKFKDIFAESKFIITFLGFIEDQKFKVDLDNLFFSKFSNLSFIINNPNDIVRVFSEFEILKTHKIEISSILIGYVNSPSKNVTSFLDLILDFDFENRGTFIVKEKQTNALFLEKSYSSLLSQIEIGEVSDKIAAILYNSIEN